VQPSRYSWAMHAAPADAGSLVGRDLLSAADLSPAEVGRVFDEEITSDVMDGPRSLILDHSGNRLHVQKALLVELLGAVG
jgi:ornithine carbamoyltransferase